MEWKEIRYIIALLIAIWLGAFYLSGDIKLEIWIGGLILCLIIK